MTSLLRLGWTNAIDGAGFKALQLDLIRNDKVVETIACISGAPSRQNEAFVHPTQDFSGSLRPLPEGVYGIGRIEKGNFDAGIGDTWIPVTVLPPYAVNNRGAFGFHMDANQATAPGSAGCIVFRDRPKLQTLEGWLKKQDAPSTLVVDWKLGFLAEKGFETFNHDVLSANVEAPPSRISKKGLKLVKHFEGKRLDAYVDVAGIWTIGYGHTAGVKEGQTITDTQAEGLLIEDLRGHETNVRKLVKVPLKQWQFDALVSFDFNLGRLSTSTLLKLLNAGDVLGAADQFLVWNKATVNGVLKPVAGLTRRRKSERELFLNDKLNFFTS